MYGLGPRRTAESPYGASSTGSPPLSGCARLAWFPDGYRVSIFPYRSALRPNPASRAHRPRNSAFPTAVGHWLTKGRRSASLLAKASKFSALARRKPRARLTLAPTSLAAPARSPHAVLRASPWSLQARVLRSSLAGRTLAPHGEGKRGRALPSHGPDPHCNRHPHVLGFG
jgi:hypothetical protein